MNDDATQRSALLVDVREQPRLYAAAGEGCIVRDELDATEYKGGCDEDAEGYQQAMTLFQGIEIGQLTCESL